MSTGAMMAAHALCGWCQITTEAPVLIANKQKYVGYDLFSTDNEVGGAVDPIGSIYGRKADHSEHESISYTRNPNGKQKTGAPGSRGGISLFFNERMYGHSVKGSFYTLVTCYQQQVATEFAYNRLIVRFEQTQTGTTGTDFFSPSGSEPKLYNKVVIDDDSSLELNNDLSGSGGDRTVGDPSLVQASTSSSASVITSNYSQSSSSGTFPESKNSDVPYTRTIQFRND